MHGATGGAKILYMRRIAWIAVGVWLLSARAGTAFEAYEFDAPQDFLAPADEWVIWKGTLDRHAEEAARFRACVVDEAACEKSMRTLRPVLIRGATLDTDDKVRLANRYINRRHYRNDRDWTTTISVSTRQRNQWRSLLEFLEKGGDCEDYATAKYFLLRALGVPADDLRVVVAWDRKSRGYHALLAYRTPGSAWLLDTDGTIKRGPQQRFLRFLFSLNEVGIWDHARKTG